MRRANGQDGHVDAQVVGHTSELGRRGYSSRSQPRHTRDGRISEAQEDLIRPRRISEQPRGLARSSTGDGIYADNPTSAMPPRLQQRWDWSATEHLEERSGDISEEDDVVEKPLVHQRRHSEPLQDQRRPRQRRIGSLRDSEPESESESDSESESESEDGESDYGHESTVSRSAWDDANPGEEADDEAAARPRRYSDRQAPQPMTSNTRGKAKAVPEEAIIRSRAGDELNLHRELVLREKEEYEIGVQSEHEEPSASRSRPPQRPKAPAQHLPVPSQSHRSSHRSSKQTHRGHRSHETPRAEKTSTVTSSRSSTASTSRRPTHALGPILPIAAPLTKKHSKHTASGRKQKGRPPQPERIECVICMSDVSIKKAAHLKCDHWMCNSCIKRAFTLSVEDSAHMPPKCCTKDPIQIRHAERLFDDHFKRNWNSKFTEYTTKNRLYCPARRCGHFIKPSKIKTKSDGRQYARCSHCDTKVCAKCSNRWHKTFDCPKDDTIDKFLAQAKKEGWQRCYQCKAMVELREGCNHMTCRCGANFCILCGTKWKGCDCPWFSDAAIAADRRAHMIDQPGPPAGAIADEMYGQDLLPPEPPAMPNYGLAPLPMRPRTYDYQDAAAYGTLDAGYASYDMAGHADTAGMGPVSHGEPGYHYQYHPSGSSALGMSLPPLTAPYDRPSDYLSTVSSARGGMRERDNSVERRLRDRLAPTMSPDPGPMPGGHGHDVPLPAAPVGWSYNTLPVGNGIDPSTGRPLVLQDYPYMRGQRHINMQYNSMDPTVTMPQYQSSPMYDCYGQQQVMEPNVPRRRRRAQERERERRGSSRASSSVTATGTTTTNTTEVKSSSLAGLTGPGRGMNRVAEWSYHVEPGKPGSTVGARR